MNEQIENLRSYLADDDMEELDENLVEMVEPFLDTLKKLSDSELHISPGVNGDVYLQWKVQDETNLVIKLQRFGFRKFPYIEGTCFFADKRVLAVDGVSYNPKEEK